MHVPLNSLFSSTQQWTLELADVFIQIVSREEDFVDLAVSVIGFEFLIIENLQESMKEEKLALFEWTQIVQTVSSRIQVGFLFNFWEC